MNIMGPTVDMGPRRNSKVWKSRVFDLGRQTHGSVFFQNEKLFKKHV